MQASNATSSRFWHRAKRWLYLVHRWTGIASCLLFAMWFVSGLVMIYVPFPSLTADERLASLPAIDWSAVRFAPRPALEAAGVSRPPPALSLEMRGPEPVWRVSQAGGDEIMLSAADGRKLGAADQGEARRVAEMFGRSRVSRLSPIHRDQWTVANGFDRHRPLWKAELAQPTGRVLYISSATGSVVLDTDARERFWNWLGSVPHWIYFTELRKHNAAWRQAVMWISGPCMLVAFSGLWIGILRTRIGKRRFRQRRITPYRGWMVWHHVAGLIGGLMLTGWIFSGWLSVDPGRLFESGGIGSAELVTYQGAQMPPQLDMSELARAAPGAKQVELRWGAGRPSLFVHGLETVVLDPTTLRSRTPDLRSLSAAQALIAAGPLASTERLTEPDLYWYDVGSRPLLPVLRLKYRDPARTWVHIDPASGMILGSIDTRGRAYRWMFDLLHKWDLNLLTLNRPAWDVLLWFFSLAGLITSISAIRLGFRRLSRRAA